MSDPTEKVYEPTLDEIRDYCRVVAARQCTCTDEEAAAIVGKLDEPRLRALCEAAREAQTREVRAILGLGLPHELDTPGTRHVDLRVGGHVEIAGRVVRIVSVEHRSERGGPPSPLLTLAVEDPDANGPAATRN